ncbi:hypothetical protein HDU93_009183, partial [Gonapodya sp. JEL0774]
MTETVNVNDPSKRYLAVKVYRSTGAPVGSSLCCVGLVAGKDMAAAAGQMGIIESIDKESEHKDTRRRG